MAPLTRQLLLLVGGLAGFVALWLSALAFLAQDACLDRGGALSGPWFACILPDGVSLPWFALVRPLLTLATAAVVGSPIFFLVRYFIRRAGGPL